MDALRTLVDRMRVWFDTLGIEEDRLYITDVDLNTPLAPQVAAIISEGADYLEAAEYTASETAE